MSQQYPEQPGWGQQPQQPGYGPPQQAWGTPPPPPPKKSTGKIIGLGCAGILALFVIIGIFGAALGGGSDNDSKGSTVSAGSDAEETSPAEKDAAAEETEEAAPESPVKITAKKAAFAKSILADGSNYTSVKVTVTNNGDETIDVNPLYFTITDTGGTKHTAELAADENQIDTVKLAPGENVSGSITGKGKFTPEYVTYIDGLLGDPIRSDVS
jgi:cytoskeletal protein RodZ